MGLDKIMNLREKRVKNKVVWIKGEWKVKENKEKKV